MIKSQRPLGLIFVTKDDTPERIAFMYPHIIEAPLDVIEEEIQLDTNSILIESNKLVDGQRTSLSADDSDSDLVSSFEKSSNDEINKISNLKDSLPSIIGRTTHKSETLTRSTSSFENEEEKKKEEEYAKIRNNFKSNAFGSNDSFGRKESTPDFKINRNNYSSNSLRRNNNSTDSMQYGDLKNEETDLNKRREKKKRLPIKIIAAMLQPVDSMSGVPFEVKIDKVRYVCNPWQIRRTAQCIAVVFVLHASCSYQIVEAYQNLSRKLAIAIDTEQTRCGYLRDEMQIIQPYLDSAEDSFEDFHEPTSEPKNNEYIPFVDIEKHSSLAKTLRQVYEDVYSYGIVDVFINDCIQVGFCVDPCHIAGNIISSVPIGDVENITNILQPYHTVLFYEDGNPVFDFN